MTRGRLMLQFVLASMVVAGCSIQQTQKDGQLATQAAVSPHRAGTLHARSPVGRRPQHNAPRVLASLAVPLQATLMSTVIIPPIPQACNVASWTIP